MVRYPRKRFGQHFLCDPDTISRIISAIVPKPKDTVVEIGPGEGALTYPLHDRVSLIHAVEIDRDLADGLELKTLRYPKLRVHRTDALKVDFAELLEKQPARFVGNLPYNISTALIFHLALFQDHVIDMHLMLQREVVQRLVASVGSKQYGRLSVVAGYCFGIDALFDVSPPAFVPSPKVVSTFVRFKPQPEFSRSVLKELDMIVRLAFVNRRKTMANALSSLFTKKDLECIGIDPCCRADNLEINQFLNMLKYLNEQRR